MTVRLLVDFKDPADGKQYVVGNLYTSAANEAGLIATKQATSDLTGGTKWVAPSVPESIDETHSVNVVRDASGNTVLVGAGRNIPLVRKWEIQKNLTTERVLEKFQNIADWSVVNAANTKASTNTDGAGPFSTNAIRFTAAAIASQNATVTKDITFNMNGLDGFWMLTDVHNRMTTAQVGLTLYASHEAGLAGAVGRFTCVNPISAGAVSLQPWWVPKASWSVLDGAPNWANNMLSFRARIDSTPIEARDFSLCGIFSGGARPTVMITLDDGWDTGYSIGFVQAQKRGIPLTHYLIAEEIGTAGNVTLAQVQEMRAAGDYLGMHGTDRWDLDVTRIATCAAALQALGIDTAHAAYPEGQIGYGTNWLATEAALSAAGVKTARLAGGSSPTLRKVGDPYALTSFPLAAGTTLAAAKAAVDLAVTSGGTVIFYGHKFGAVADSLTWVTADYTALLDYIAQKRFDGLIDVTTIDRWWDGV